MRLFYSFLILSQLLFFSSLQAKSSAPYEEKIGIISRFLVKGGDQVIGFILHDGTMVNIPPRMTNNILSIVKLDDVVTVKGFRLNAKLIAAESITNTSSTSIVDEVESSVIESHAVKKIAESPIAEPSNVR